MRYAYDGQVVYLSTHHGFERCVVLVAAGNDARIKRDGDGFEFWVPVDSLFTEEAVAKEAARRLGAPQ